MLRLPHLPRRTGGLVYRCPVAIDLVLNPVNRFLVAYGLEQMPVAPLSAQVFFYGDFTSWHIGVGDLTIHGFLEREHSRLNR